MIRTSDKAPRILHRARSSIQHIFLDWQRDTLYWLARGQPLQAMTLAGDAPWDAWNETWPGDLPAAMDSRAFSVLWSSALGEPCWCLKQRGEVVDVGGVISHAPHAAVPCLGSGVLMGQTWDPGLSHEVPAIAVCCGVQGEP